MSSNLCPTCHPFSAVTLLVGRQEGHLACKKTEWWVAGMVICLERGADLHMAQLMLLPLTVSCFSKIQIGFTVLVPAHLGSPGKGAVKRVSVCLSYVQHLPDMTTYFHIHTPSHDKYAQTTIDFICIHMMKIFSQQLDSHKLSNTQIYMLHMIPHREAHLRVSKSEDLAARQP